MPRPLRTSCDRCHSQKLKCPKQPGIAICTRCAKAGASCVFSAAGPSARRTPLSLGHEDFGLQPQLGGFDVDLDWFSGGSLNSGQPDAPFHSQTILHPDLSSIQDEHPRSACVRQLLSLAQDFDHTSASIPSESQLHMDKDAPLPDVVASWAEKYGQRQCLEQLFASGQRLLDLYYNTIRLIFEQPGGDACEDGNCLHRQDLPADVEEKLAEALVVDHGKPTPMDPFVFNLLVICHTRFNDILTLLMVHMKTCVRVHFASPTASDPKLHIPALKVGSFVASPESSSSMQAVLLVHIASVLVDRAKQLAEKVQTATKEEKSTTKAQMFRLQCQALVEEGESNVIALKKVRDVLVHIGWMR
ncbi:uncharacterized protein JN550_013198 [Neoarthrinium moseri]|uniref:uncharacterized protein n=1 Tax=Neoarthrinium moseri TaxID=1658444 RepID=UPI001FDCA849|nr:uncharacterized protein JN550_013198 [Neoarthrinium moseri]KAI1857565.1 hypothetical protein JN550_013198 [Neoarthrinium moseri]